MQNKTLVKFKELKEQTKNDLNNVKNLLNQLERFGVVTNNTSEKKLENIINSLDNEKLKVVLVGGYSEGKTSIASVWLGKVFDNMNISPLESSNEIVAYEDDKICLIDTPGLYGFKEKKLDDNTVEKYKDITKKYISEANIILYVMNSINPIKHSHQDDIKWMFDELGLLKRTVFVLSKFDEAADLYDDDDYESTLATTKDNVTKALKNMIVKNSSLIDNAKIIGVSANPYDEGFEYWQQNDDFEKISHIKDLQNITSEIISQYSFEDLLLDTKQSIKEEFKQLYESKILEILQNFDERIENLEEDIRRHNNRLTDIQNEVAEIKIKLPVAIDEFFSDLIVRASNLSETTINEFIMKNIGEDGGVLANKVNELIFDNTNGIANSIKEQARILDADMEFYNSKFTDYGKQGINFIRNGNFINRDNILLARDAITNIASKIGVNLNITFKPWGAVNLAKNLSGVLAIFEVALEVFDIYKQAERDKKLQEAKDEIVKVLKDEWKRIINIIKTENDLFPELKVINNEIDNLNEAKNLIQSNKDDLKEISLKFENIGYTMKYLTKDLKEYALLSKLAYSNFDNSKHLLQIIQKELSTLKDENDNNIHDAISKDFIKHYKLIYSQNNIPAMVLFQNNKNEKILCIKGTDKPSDFIADINILSNDISLHCVKLIESFNKNIIQHLKSNEKIILTGHSLGGYLAQVLAILYPTKVSKLYTFNAPGVFQGDLCKIIFNLLDLIANKFSSLRNLKTACTLVNRSAKQFLQVNSNFKDDIKRLENILSNPNSKNINYLNLYSVFHVKTCQNKEDKNSFFKNPIQDFGDHVKGTPIYINIGDLSCKNIIATHSIDNCFISLKFAHYLLTKNYQLDISVDKEHIYINPYYDNFSNNPIVQALLNDLQNNRPYKALEYIKQNT